MWTNQKTTNWQRVCLSSNFPPTAYQLVGKRRGHEPPPAYGETGGALPKGNALTRSTSNLTDWGFASGSPKRKRVDRISHESTPKLGSELPSRDFHPGGEQNWDESLRRRRTANPEYDWDTVEQRRSRPPQIQPARQESVDRPALIRPPILKNVRFAASTSAGRDWPSPSPKQNRLEGNIELLITVVTKRTRGKIQMGIETLIGILTTTGLIPGISNHTRLVMAYPSRSGI